MDPMGIHCFCWWNITVRNSEWMHLWGDVLSCWIGILEVPGCISPGNSIGQKHTFQPLTATHMGHSNPNDCYLTLKLKSSNWKAAQFGRSERMVKPFAPGQVKVEGKQDICNVDVYLQVGLYLFRMFQRGTLILEKHMNVDMQDIFWLYWYLYTTLIGVAIALLRPCHKTSKL